MRNNGGSAEGGRGGGSRVCVQEELGEIIFQKRESKKIKQKKNVSCLLVSETRCCCLRRLYSREGRFASCWLPLEKKTPSTSFNVEFEHIISLVEWYDM